MPRGRASRDSSSLRKSWSGDTFVGRKRLEKSLSPRGISMKSSTALNGGEDRVGEPQETRKTRLWKTHHEDLQRERKRVAAGEEGSRQGFFAKEF